MSNAMRRTARLARHAAFAMLSIAVAPACIAGANHQVHLYRDSVGMAHLYADREEDGFYGLGYAIGEDRLLQVLTWYVAARGELAATFGPTTPPLPGDATPPSPGESRPLVDALANDLVARKFRLLPVARGNFRQLPRQYQKDLRAYIEGLRAYMHEHPDRTPRWAPPLEPALPLAILRLIVIDELHVCDARRAADGALPQAALDRPTSQGAYGPLGASNGWALSGSRTPDGGVIFESDSHGSIETYGTLFYPFRIKAGDLDFMAFAPAASVLFLFGHSPYFAWGVTEGPRFPADCYRVSVERGSPRRFRYDGHLQTMTVAPYTLAVKGHDPVHGVFEYTHHNGVTSPVMARDLDSAYVVSYASADRVGLESGQYYRMAKARNRAQLESALAQLDAYPANLIIGGADGTIMYIRPGRTPVRAADVDVRHTLDGNHSSTAWRGIHPYADTLKLINPPQGYVANSNVSPDMMFRVSPLQPHDYPRYFGFDPGHTNSRQQRLIDLFDGDAQVTMDEAMAIALDEMIATARPWGAAIARAMRDQPDELANQPELRPFLEDLADFDGVFSKESRGALAHTELRRVLRERHPELVSTLEKAIESAQQLSTAQQRLILEASVEARQRLLTRYGRADLTWGEVHRVGRGEVDLPIGGGYLLDTGDLQDAESLRALSFREDPKTRQQRLIFGERIPFIVHFTAAGAQSYAQTLPGVSDDPTSAHFSDQARLASDRILRPIPQSLAALERELTSSEVLTVGASLH
jgi:acyl-homoserine-lactone acylase